MEAATRQEDEKKSSDAEESSEEEEETMLVFKLRLENPEPAGTNLAATKAVFIQIVSDTEESSKEDQL